MRITIIRHPETDSNRDGIIYGRKDSDYTERGKLQFKNILSYLHSRKKCKVFSSEKKRAKRLAEEIQKTIGGELIVSSSISEMNFGVFEGKTLEEIKEKYEKEYHDFRYRFETTSIPEGESYREFSSRVKKFSEDLKKLDEDVIIVSHGAVIRELLEVMLDLKSGGSWKFKVTNGVIIELEKDDYGYSLAKLLDSNDMEIR